MDKRIGIIGIVVEQLAAAEQINAVLHDYAGLIVGRMGIPYRERGVSIISLIVDGSNDDISALTGKLGRIPGASVKSMITKNFMKEGLCYGKRIFKQVSKRFRGIRQKWKKDFIDDEKSGKN